MGFLAVGEESSASLLKLRLEQLKTIAFHSNIQQHTWLTFWGTKGTAKLVMVGPFLGGPILSSHAIATSSLLLPL